MLFFDSPNPAPNPRRVRIFLAEKGLDIPRQEVSIMAREHKGDEYLKLNPLGQTPSLQLDDGSVLTESVAICRYLDALHPEPPLFGRTPEEIGRTDMWSRRVELRLMVPVSMIWVHTHPYTARVVPKQHTEFGESNRPAVKAAMKMLDTQLGEQPFVAGPDYTMADILALSIVDFAGFIGIELPDEYQKLKDWHTRVSARPSAQA